MKTALLWKFDRFLRPAGENKTIFQEDKKIQYIAFSCIGLLLTMKSKQDTWIKVEVYNDKSKSQYNER